MKYLYWIGAVLVVAVGLYISMHMPDIGPQALPKIEFTQVSLPEEFGKAVFEKLRPEVTLAPVIFLGVTPNKIEQIELWRGFLEANQGQGSKYDVIVVESMLPYVEIFNVVVHIPLKEEISRVADGIKKAREQNLRVAIIGPNIYSSQLIKENVADKLQTEYQIPVTSLTVSEFPLTRDQEKTFEPACAAGGAVDPAGTSGLGCMIRTVARKTYTKKFEARKYSGLMDKTGAKDYLILFNRN